MRKEVFLKVLLLIAMAIGFWGVAVAQDGKTDERPPMEAQSPPANQPPDIRGGLFRQLGLSREQIEQIRRLNIERRPVMQEAQRRFREANHALDASIYSDRVNEADIEARLKDVLSAQAEIQRLRFMNELSVRRVLTQEQLVRFRELREEFERTRHDMHEGRPFRPGRPMRPRMPDADPNPLDRSGPPAPVIKQEQKPN